MIQPKTRRFATDATISSGVDLGLSTKLEPTTGRFAQGYQKLDRLGGRQFNWLVDDVAARVAAIEGLAAINFPTFQDVSTSGASSVDIQSLTRLVAVRGSFGSDTLPKDWLVYTDTTAGLLAYFKMQEGTNWVGMTDPSFAASRNVVAGEVSGTPTFIVWDAGTGTIKKSTAMAGSWSAAGSVTAAVNAYEGIWWPKTGRWFIAGINKVWYSDTLANSAWTEITVSGGSGHGVQCAGVGSDGVAFGTPHSTTQDYIVYSPDGAAFSLVESPGAFISIDYSESHQLWVATVAGNIYTAPNGMSSWSLAGPVGAGTAWMIKAFGSHFVAACQYGLMVAQDPAGPWVRVRDTRTTGGFTDLVICGGQLVAAERFNDGTDDHWYIYPSLRAPFQVFT
jgi:hypothetical protein